MRGFLIIPQQWRGTNDHEYLPNSGYSSSLIVILLAFLALFIRAARKNTEKTTRCKNKTGETSCSYLITSPDWGLVAVLIANTVLIPILFKGERLKRNSDSRTQKALEGRNSVHHTGYAFFCFRGSEILKGLVKYVHYNISLYRDFSRISFANTTISLHVYGHQRWRSYACSFEIARQGKPSNVFDVYHNQWEKRITRFKAFICRLWSWKLRFILPLQCRI